MFPQTGTGERSTRWLEWLRSSSLALIDEPPNIVLQKSSQLEKNPETLPIAMDALNDAVQGNAIEASETAWEQWFAWYPVKLYMSTKYAWRRRIYRRCVTRAGFTSRDYTDSPDQYPRHVPPK